MIRENLHEPIRQRRTRVALLIMAVSVSFAAVAQAPSQAVTQPAQANASVAAGDARTKAAELRRQKLQEDVDRLVLMAESLKATVNIVKKDELSVEVVREADRIERLAKSVKESARQ